MRLLSQGGFTFVFFWCWRFSQFCVSQGDAWESRPSLHPSSSSWDDRDALERFLWDNMTTLNEEILVGTGDNDVVLFIIIMRIAKQSQNHVFKLYITSITSSTIDCQSFLDFFLFERKLPTPPDGAVRLVDLVLIDVLVCVSSVSLSSDFWAQATPATIALPSKIILSLLMLLAWRDFFSSYFFLDALCF